MSTKPYAQPDRSTVSAGRPRRVGFELEFAAMELPLIADIICDVFGGAARRRHAAEITIDTPDYGEFLVELDAKLVKRTAGDAHKLAGLFTMEEIDRYTDWMARAAGQVVPAEIVCPPINIDELHVLDSMVDRLRESGALGTDQSLIYAFGVHINPELPDLEAATVLEYLKAYAVAQQWLLETNRVDTARRITPYIDLFPRKYIRHLLAYDGDKPMSLIIDDYLAYNPTRNRALDMLPLFSHIDEERVCNKVDDERIKPRPTFHYRMPNCEIEKSSWGLADSWNTWCVIERLSEDRELLSTLCTAWLRTEADKLQIGRPEWYDKLDKIHRDLS